MILDGKVVAQNTYEELKKNISELSKKPSLRVILVGNNPSSLRYVAQKQKWAHYVGIDFQITHFEENTSQEAVLQKLNEFNNNPEIDGFMVQLPLPKHLNEKMIIDQIAPEKDVDGFHPFNQGNIVIWEKNGLKACTPAGILTLLSYYNIDLVGKNIVIIGRSNIVGKPLANMFINAQATVSICNSKTKNIEFFTQNADIVVTALWVPHFLKAEMVKKEAIIIDVGFTVVDGKIYWDADFEKILSQGNDITPVPGGVGVLTVSELMRNTYQAHINKSQKS